jgi:C4-type Zn-finger protein
MSTPLTCPACQRTQVTTMTCPNCETDLTTLHLLASLPHNKTDWNYQPVLVILSVFSSFVGGWIAAKFFL